MSKIFISKIAGLVPFGLAGEAVECHSHFR